MCRCKGLWAPLSSMIVVRGSDRLFGPGRHCLRSLVARPPNHVCRMIDFAGRPTTIQISKKMTRWPTMNQRWGVKIEQHKLEVSVKPKVSSKSYAYVDRGHITVPILWACRRATRACGETVQYLFPNAGGFISKTGKAYGRTSRWLVAQQTHPSAPRLFLKFRECAAAWQLVAVRGVV